MQQKWVLQRFATSLLLWSLTSCITPPSRYEIHQDHAPKLPVNLDHVQDAIPQHAPLSRYGNPEHYTVLGRRYWVLKTARGYHARGLASWYGMKFQGHLTSSREPYQIDQMTAAHRTLPIPTYVQVTHLNNGKRVIVKINDRGPFIGHRLIDLSYAAAQKLDMLKEGLAFVEVQVVTPSSNRFSVSHSSTTLAATHPVRLQLGVFRLLHNAEQLVARLRTITPEYPSKIQVIQTMPYPLYRVTMGPLQNAESVQQQLRAAGFVGVFMTNSAERVKPPF